MDARSRHLDGVGLGGGARPHGQSATDTAGCFPVVFGLGGAHPRL
jgi:hypothetical protein